LVNGLDKLQQYLREERVPFRLQHHPAAYSAAEVAASEHLPGALVAKVVVVFAAGRPVLLVLPASHRVDLAQVGAVLGADVARLAHEAELAALFPDCEVGAMPPFGNLYDLPVYVDADLTAHEHIVVPAGTHTDTIGLAYADFARLVAPHAATFAVPTPELPPD
jgi:Ala-tRNA(Pro) deacylase